ncbi:bis-aminopropyl spermidine synthase family protein, partial [Candidatus Aerophobetes bacterium]|nr:bis-aminopropyl spermidine synthase family protein [Candidatus Aerophobetes bacterium]
MRKLESQIILSLGKSPKSLWELLEENKFPLKDFIATVNRLYTEALISCKDEKIILTEKGKERLNKEELEFETRICDKCEGKTVLFDGKFKMILEEFKKISKKRPVPDLNYFQGYMRENDVFSRIALMHHYSDVYRKDFILIGDDDLLSVALSLTKLPSRILVLDIDGRLSTFLKEVNREYGFNIEFLKYDVKDPLPQELVGKFDVFSSEPLESLSGLKAFVLRGIVSLKKEGVGYFGLTTC